MSGKTGQRRNAKLARRSKRKPSRDREKAAARKEHNDRVRVDRMKVLGMAEALLVGSFVHRAEKQK